MIFEPGPIAPLDEAFFESYFHSTLSPQTANALAPLVAQVYAGASHADTAYGDLAAASEHELEGNDTDGINRVLFEAGIVAGEVEREPSDDIARAFDDTDRELWEFGDQISEEGAPGGIGDVDIPTDGSADEPEHDDHGGDDGGTDEVAN